MKGLNQLHPKLADFLSLGESVLAYFMSVWVGLQFSLLSEGLTAVWPASGVAIGILLLKDFRAWWYLLPAFFAVNLFVFLIIGNPLPVVLSIAAVRTLEQAAGAGMIVWLVGGQVTFTKARHFVALWLVAVTVNGVFTSLVMLIESWFYSISFGTSWREWQVGTTISMMLITPLIVHWAGAMARFPNLLRAIPRRRWIELVIFSLALIAFTLIIFGKVDTFYGLTGRPYMMYLFLGWAALRYGTRGALTALTGIYVLALTITAAGHGNFPLGGENIADRLVAVQTYLGLATISITLISVILVERKQAEEALSESLQRISAHIDNSPLAIIELDEQLQVMRWSREAQKIFGWKAAEMTGRSLFTDKFVHEEDLAAVILEREGMVAGTHPQTFSLNRNYRKDGSIVHCEWYNSSVYNQEGRLVSVLSQILDVSERVQVEKISTARLRIANYAISHSLEEVLQHVLNEIEAATSSSIGFFHFLEADQSTLSLQNWSSRTVNEFCTAQGRGAHFPVEQAGIWADCIREKRVIVHNHYPTHARQKGLPPGHAVLLRELVVPIFRGGQIVAILGVGNKPKEYDDKDIELASRLADLSWDIVERKKVEQALTESELRYRIIADNTYDWEFWVDPQGEFIYNSPSCMQITGYGADDFVRNPSLYTAVIHPEDLDIYRKHYEFANRERQPCGVDYRIIKRDGEIRWISHLCQPVYDDEGNYRGIRGNNRDVTQNKLAELALRQSLNDKENLMRELQHRTKNNLNVVISLLQFGQNNLKDPQAQAVVMDVQSRIYSMVAVYDQLYRKGMVDQIELGKYVQRVAAELASSYLPVTGRIKMKVRVDEILFDLRRAVPLGLILNELIINAIKYAFPGDSSGQIQVELKRGNGNVILCVSDDGIGMPFTDVGATPNGTGLRLVRILAKQIKGDLKFEICDGTSVLIEVSEAAPAQPNNAAL